MEKRDQKLYPTYETEQDLINRVLVFLREAAVTYLGKTVLVVTHGGMIRSLLMHLGFGSFDELPSGCVENTGYIVLQSDGVDFFIKETKGINKKQVVNQKIS